MNEKIVFIRTVSGEGEAQGRTALLSKDIKRALLMVDGTSSVAEIMKRSSPSLRSMLQDMFIELVRGGFIQDKLKAVSPRIVVPAKPAVEEELDFTAAYRVPTPAQMDEERTRLAAAEQEAAHIKAEQDARMKAEQEAARIKAEQEARLKVEHDARMKAEQEAARIKAEQEARLKAEQDARMKAEQEAARIKAEQEARLKAEQDARMKAEQEAARIKAEQEARLKAEQDARMKAEQDAARIKAEQEARLKAEQDARMKAEQDAARIKAEQEARLKAEQDARMKAEQEAARAVAIERAKLEAETARMQAELQARAEERARADAARVEAQQEAERLARELAAREKQEAAEARAREQAEHQAIEAARKAEQLLAEEKSRLELEVARLKLEAEAHARAVAEEQARLEAVQKQEAERLKAEQLEEARRAEAAELAREARIKEEQAEAALRAEAERHAREMAEQKASQIKAEADARAIAEEKLRLEEELAVLRADAQAQSKKRSQAEAEAEARAREQIRIDVQALAQAYAVRDLEQDEARIEQAIDAVRISAEEDESDKEAQLAPLSQPPIVERRRTVAAVSGCDSRGGNNGVPVVERRTTTAAVLFFDIVGYTKQSDRRQLEFKQQFNQLVTKSLAPLDAGERIILDTGDGAAIGFLQHPTDALESAMNFRSALIANSHGDYPDLRVRIGIHLGPVSLVKDMNGQVNMLGDGINSAQRVMSFAGQDQIYLSRAFFEFVSNLNDEHKELFRYRGTQQDKHGREHQVYELLSGEETVNEVVSEASTETSPVGFSFGAFDTVLDQVAMPEVVQPPQEPVLADVAALAEVAEIKPEPQVLELVQAAEAPQYSEAESRHLAEVQAKKWAEAQSRAAETPPRKAETAPVRSALEVKAVSSRRRKPLPWGKMLAGLVVLFVLVLFALPFVLPTEQYRVNLEQALSAKLQQKVHIARLDGRILPTPHLLLSDVDVGEAKQMQVRQTRVNFSSLLGAVKPVSVEMEGVQVHGDALALVSAWLQQIAVDPQYPVSAITLSHAGLDAEGLQLSDVEGALSFDPSGKFSLAKLNARKLALEIRAAPEQKFAVIVSLRDGALPLLPGWVFEELKATGELGRDELRISDLDGKISGGALSGDVRINWRAGWRVQGNLVAKAVELQGISKLLSGDMDGTARFQMQADQLSRLVDAAVLNGVFSVKKGVVNGVDIVETARLQSRESLPGGRTHFDEMGGELAYSGGNYRFTALKINSGVLKARGSLMISGQDLSGNMSADLAMRAGSVPLQFGGTTASPALRAH